MRERRVNPVGRSATAGVPRITLGGLRLAVLDLEGHLLRGCRGPVRRRGLGGHGRDAALLLHRLRDLAMFKVFP